MSIAQAIANWIEAKAIKARCPHQWSKIHDASATLSSFGHTHSMIIWYCCSKCGEHRKITTP